MKSMGAFYWYVNILQCWFMEHGLKYIAVYIQKLRAVCYNSPLVCDKPLGVPASVRRVYSMLKYFLSVNTPNYHFDFF